MKLVLFDCDGTLVDSAAIIHSSMERTFDEAGFQTPDLVQTKSVIGLSLEIAIARMLEREIDEQINHMANRYRHHSQLMRSAQDCHEPFYDGVWELLDALRQVDEILIGVVTGKSRRGLNNLLAKHDLGSAIISTRTADECPSKPHPAMVMECCAEAGVDPSRTIVIGDAVYDMQMARNAGATAAGVTWGYCDKETLQEAGAHHIVEEPAELMPIIGALAQEGQEPCATS
ncbi:HAD-IA family hydrolase [Hoeflea sp. TYP-13]|uniref:HAD-IA family hydrolase n=1 Tax=Hoeflea sp. TYP-13 TaxID=3230023 RepID=UPI0034C67701